MWRRDVQGDKLFRSLEVGHLLTGDLNELTDKYHLQTPI